MSRYKQRPPLELTERHQRQHRNRPPEWHLRLPPVDLIRLGKGMVITAAVSVLIAYAGVTLYHLSNGFDFGSALIGGTRDARILAACWQDMGLVQEFVQRPAFLGSDPAAVAQALAACPKIARGVLPMGRDQAVAAVRAAAELVRPARLAMIRMISARRGCLTAPAAASARILRG